MEKLNFNKAIIGVLAIFSFNLHATLLALDPSDSTKTIQVGTDYTDGLAWRFDANSQLINIYNLASGGLFYDIAFVEGSFNSLFTGVNSGNFDVEPTFNISTGSAGVDPIRALSDVFSDVNSPVNFQNRFDIFGCETNPSFCLIRTLSHLNSNSNFVNTYGFSLNDFGASATTGAAIGVTIDSTDFSNTVYTDWSIANVNTREPLPASSQHMALLLVLGILFVFIRKGAVMRHKS